jgi:hypothetical protein
MPLQIFGGKKMEKLNSIRKGQIWLTVFKTDDGEIAITICKSYPTTRGWKQTNFLRPETGDIKKLLEALHEFNKLYEAYSRGEILPRGFCQHIKPKEGETK